MKERKNAIKIVLLAIVLGLVLLIAMFNFMKRHAKPMPEATEAAMPVLTMPARLTSTADIVFLPALIEANVDAMLAAEKAGRIVALKADRGDRVEKGQLLLQIDDRIWQTNLKQANIAAKDAEKNFGRFKTLKESGAVADSEFDSIETAHIRAEAMATEAEINIEQCRVESPVNGTVNDRFVEEGEYVQPGTPVFQVVDTATLKVVVQIPEKDIYSIQLGDTVSFGVQPLKDRTFEGKVTFVAARADGRNNAFRAEITVENSDGILRPGMIALVEFHRGINENMVSLPMSAVLPSKGDHIVYLASDGQAVRRKVTLETITRKNAMVSHGLEEGELVIIEGNRTLSDGQRVEIVEAGGGE
ncbi:Macrolide export protein MacA [Pontiella desulfatans]|uniref:Macrolide export protein MacA n=1 Tax=Pontiella desulfatans TaxID=2750659 RepID=A0A6C2TVB8_PONDE|nr:efflux RND transporter periplasmic adaptor subunit [Pontiella desulfatans]VGO11559.1 Macrolide export protein MacA [Pontiella desulfatans]